MTPSEMRKLYESGLSSNQIAKLCKKSGETVRYHLHNAGVPLRDKSDAKLSAMGMHGFWSAERIILMEKMWNEGKSGKAIGEALGCSKNAVHGKANRMGLFKLPEPSRKSRTRGVEKAKFGTANHNSTFRHKSLISFLPDHPFLQKRFELEVAKAQAERGML